MTIGYSKSKVQDQYIRTVESSGSCASITSEHFVFKGQNAACAIAFISPYLDFTETIQTLCRLAGSVPLVAASTAGELCAISDDSALYKPFSPDHPHIILQVFSPELVSDVAIRSVSLHCNTLPDGKLDKTTQQQRINTIVKDLQKAAPHFAIEARDTLALTFFEGFTLCGDDFMEAVYKTGLFPCLFAGGSAGTFPGGQATYLFDGREIRENYAVIVFLKINAGKRFSVLKSQNYKKAHTSLIAVDTDPITGLVTTLLDPTTDTVMPATAAVASALGCSPEEIETKLHSFSFGIELDDEIFIRSVNKVLLQKQEILFHTSINQGDELHIVQATDIVRQTKKDIENFLKDKPTPLAVLLNDCTMRREDNQDKVSRLRNLWPCPAVGFSTFGELLGIGMNQTLTAVAFFEDTDPPFPDPFIDFFPVHYAKFQDFFRLVQLRRIEVSTRLRADITRRLARHLGASSELVRHIEGMLDHRGNLQESLDSIRMTIAREVETINRAKQAEEYLLDAIEAMNEGFVLYDKDHRLVMSNSHLRGMFEQGEEIFIPGRRFDEILPMLIESGAYGKNDNSLETPSRNFMEEHLHPDGISRPQLMADGRWVTSRMYRTRDGGVVGVRTDITKVKKHANELERLKQSYELLLKTAGDGILGINTEGQITFANPAAQTMLQLPAEAMEGQTFSDVMGSHCIPDLIESDIQPTSGECGCVKRNGQTFTAEYTLTPAYDNKTLTGAVLVFRDITLRKTYENNIANQHKILEQLVQERTHKLSQEIMARVKIDNALKESQQRLLGITNSLMVGVLLVDRTGLIVFANPAAYRCLRYDTLLEQHIDKIFTLEKRGNSVPFKEGPFTEILKTGQSLINDDAVFLVKNGNRLQTSFSAALLDEGRKRQVVVITFREIKALKNAQREAMQASRLASVGQLAAGIAHEINTPIQYVGDNLHFMEDTFTDLAETLEELAKAAPSAQDLLKQRNISFLLDEYPTAINHALHGVEHVSHIVRSMKDFSHPGTELKVCLDINHAVESTITVCRNEWKQVANIHMDLSPNVGEIQCFAADLNQVLLNLIVNAAHALESMERNEKGNIYISTSNDGIWVEIRITDDGPGIPEHQREQIFAPFFTTKPIGKGTGQGLSICQDIIVKKHEGQLFLDENVTDGTCFVVRLPALSCVS